MTEVVMQGIKKLAEKVRSVADQEPSKLAIADQLEALLIVMERVAIEGTSIENILINADIKRAIVDKGGMATLISFTKAVASGIYLPGQGVDGKTSLLSDLPQKDAPPAQPPAAARPKLASNPLHVAVEQAQREHVSPASLQLDL